MMEDLQKEAQEKIQELQQIEQNLNNFGSQRQNFQMQLIELENALKEVALVPTAYRIIGNVMVSSPREDIVADLTSKKEVAELRIRTIERQEEKLREKASQIQKEVLASMKGGQNGE